MDLQKRGCLFDWRCLRREARRQSSMPKALTWYLPSQVVEANGDVVYRQVEPPAVLQVKKAVRGNQDQTIVVNGGGNRVFLSQKFIASDAPS